MLSKSTEISFVDLIRTIRSIAHGACAIPMLAQLLAAFLVLLAVSSNVVAEDYTFTTFAGSASRDGTGTNARFDYFKQIAVDGSGTVYVTDRSSFTIRKIMAGGVVTTIAGLPGVHGSVDAAGSDARFEGPQGIVSDGSGNLYVSDSRTIRKVTAAGVVTTIAGSSSPGATDGPGVTARFYATSAIAIDAAGVLYVADGTLYGSQQSIRKIDLAGNVSTLGGIPCEVGGIAVASDGMIYISGKTDQVIYQMTPSGMGSILAGTLGVGGNSTYGRFSGPAGIALNSSGVLYVSDSNNNNIARIDRTTGTRIGDTVCISPLGIAVATDGTVFIGNTESGGGTIKKLTSPGNVISTYAGNATYTTNAGFVDDIGQAARFDHPRAMTRASDGTLYVADTNNYTIRKIAVDGTVSTVAGSPGLQGFVDGLGSTARFYQPFGIAVDSAANLYVSDADSIRKINSAGLVTTLVTQGSGLYLPRGIAIRANGDLVVGGGGNSALFLVTPAGVVSKIIVTSVIGGGYTGNPFGVAVGANDLFYFTSQNHQIRTQTAAGVENAVAGSLGGFTDGTGPAAGFYWPEGIAVDSTGTVYVGDTLNETIRKISPAGEVITIAGTPRVTGSVDGIGSSALFDSPTELVVDGTGVIYVLDTNNSTIRKGTPPVAVTVTLSATAQGFDGTPKPVTVATSPSVTTSVTYNGSATVPTNAGSYAVVATVTQPGFSGTASGTLTITQATQTITFGTILTQTLGVAPLTLGATASSGLPVSYVVTSGPATVSGTTLTITGIGTVVVEAQQVGDANRTAATPVPQSFIVNPATPIISSATTATGTVGTAFSYAILASSTPTSYAATGLPAGLLLNSTTGIISGTPTGSAVSTVSLFATNAGGTGSATLTLTVNPAAPAITSAGTASGRVGTVFSYTITASRSPTIFGATGLPAGLTINSTTGLISGTPTAVAVSTVTLSATNAGGTGSTTLTLTVIPAVPVISSATTVIGNVGIAFTYVITASSTPTVFGATGLPAGLTLNTTTGAVSGTPTAIGVSAVTISATNAGGTGSTTLTLTVILAVPVISSATTASGTMGEAFTYTITASSNPTTFGATGLPSGLVLNTTSGVISGTPTGTGTSSVTITAINASGTGTATLTMTVAVAAPVITSAATATGAVGTAFTFTVSASGTPTSFNASGLPSGLQIDAVTGVISGTPTAATTGAVSLSATNATGTGTSVLMITIVLPTAPPTSGGDSGGGGGGCGIGGGISVILAALGMCLRVWQWRTRHGNDA